MIDNRHLESYIMCIMVFRIKYTLQFVFKKPWDKKKLYYYYESETIIGKEHAAT